MNVSLITEGIELFWSALQYVKIKQDTEQLIIEENVMLFWNGRRIFTPFKEMTLSFSNDGHYKISERFIFENPVVSRKEISDFISGYDQRLIDRPRDIEILPYELLISTLNGSSECRNMLLNYLDGNVDGAVAESYHDALNILAEVEAKHNSID